FNFLNIKSGYRVYLEKNIPISAGLAGGSADAAGVLLAMEALENKKLVYSEIGAKLGADIPFMIEAAKKHNNSDYNDNSSNVNSRNENAAKKCVNRHGSRFGDVLSVETKELSKCSYFVIGVQSYGLSTPRVYSLYDKIGGVESTTENDTTENDLLENNLLGNDLQKAALSLAPKLEQVLEVALENGANRSYITGSGPTAVAEVNSLDVAKQIETAWKKPYTENFNAVNAYTQNPKTESLASKVFIVENR
ncbi:MAG: hypothetical protein LBB10_00440, partial [Bifidobacteriaceae bacterium]|nr:hypothetical protein [Bifidobacteriaceae bacterium]